MASQTISYAQYYEDMHLLRCFGEQASGFYIDIGAGHPVYDNVSFAFYLRGWRGITVEPNPWLAQLSEAVRPHDRRIASLVGETAGQATYHLFEDFHGLSTTVERHARAAENKYGKPAQAIAMPVTTLRELCERYAPAGIDFLKIDVEGAERVVLAGGDWRRFRPKIVVLEALAPLIMTPAWQEWEPLLLEHGYRFAFFDSINRYYVADEHAALAAPLAAAPAGFDNVVPFHRFGRALDDPGHPDHGLARLFAGADMVRLPLLPPEQMVALLMAGMTGLERPAGPAEVDALRRRLFGGDAAPAMAGSLGATLRDLYRQAVATDAFRAACGRISASYAW